MAKWKVAGAMAVAMREAEKQAEQRRILEEQFQESVRNGNILRKLRRERDRTTCHTKYNLIKDQRMMKVLNNEQAGRKWDLHVANSDGFKKEDERHQEVLLENMQCQDMGVSEVKRIRDELSLVRVKEKEADKEMKETQLKLKVQNRQMANMHVIGPDKVVKRQEVANHSYGRQLEENRQLKEEISHLEIERAKVKEVHAQLEKECEDLSKELHDYTEAAKVTYENRDMNRQGMAKLRDHLEKSTAFFDSDMQLMQFQIDVLRRMERFMTTKNKFRVDEGRERRRELRSQLSATERDSISYGSLMIRIRTDLEQDDFKMIIKTFVELQEENYMLFKNISETRDACHNMMVEIEEARGKINTFRKSKQHAEEETFACKVELIDKADTCRKEADKKEEYLEKADQVMQTYIKAILTMLEKLGYTQADFDRLIGVFKCVEERNVREFLAELEHYINRLYDLKTTVDFLTFEVVRKEAGIPMAPEPLPPRLALAHRVMVLPPQHEEGDDIDDPALPTEAAFRPLAFSELCHHVDEDLEAREKREELGAPIPSPNMTDVTSEAIGDTPHSPTIPISTVDVF